MAEETIAINAGVSGGSGAKSGQAAQVFTHVPDQFPWLADRETCERLKKWNLDSTSRFETFRYNDYFDVKHAGDDANSAFLLALFNSSAFREHMRVTDANKQWSSVAGGVTGVEHSRQTCTVTNMGVFDAVYGRDGVLVSQKSDLIRGCIEERYEGVTVADELRRALLLEDDCDNYDMFDDNVRGEFIFRLFRYLCVGGGMCQWEDRVTPYLELVKTIYKSLLCVQKNKNTGALEVGSGVFDVTSVTSDAYALFASESEFNMCCVCVDPIQRHARVAYFSFPNYW